MLHMGLFITSLPYRLHTPISEQNPLLMAFLPGLTMIVLRDLPETAIPVMFLYLHPKNRRLKGG